MMQPFRLPRWLRSLFGPQAKTYRKPKRSLNLEQLETRLAPAIFTWTGAGADSNWTTPANWLGNVAPTGSPSALADLVFPAGNAPLTSTNNIPAVNGLPATFDSITFSRSGYALSGSPIALGVAGVAGSGYMIANQGAANETIGGGMNVFLPATGGVHFFTVNAAASITISTIVSGPSTSQITKQGTGTLIFGGDNTTFLGTTLVAVGVLQIQSATALGSSTAPSTVQANAQIQISNVTGPIANSVILNGPGVGGTGALDNVAGNAVWTGPIIMDSNVTIGALVGTELTVNGQISDLGAGYNLTKEEGGELFLQPLNTLAGNNYHGQTFVNGGMLAVGHPFALGPGGSTADGAIVRSSPLESGTLALDYVSNPNLLIAPQYLYDDANSNPIGFQVPTEFLTLNGPGMEGTIVSPRDLTTRTVAPASGTIVTTTGTLTSLVGQNAWEQAVDLWTSDSAIDNDFAYYEPVITFGAAQNATLTVDGVIQNPGIVLPGTTLFTSYSVSKVGPGDVVFTAANTFTADVDVLQGNLVISDSQALGASPPPVTALPPADVAFLPPPFPYFPLERLGSEEVWWGATLELQADGIPDSLSTDALGNPTYNLSLPSNYYIALNGPGANNGGALRNVSGQNTITGGVSLMSDADIDVEPDPNPGVHAANTDLDPWNDLSQLTISGVIDNNFSRTLLVDGTPFGDPSGTSLKAPTFITEYGSPPTVISTGSTLTKIGGGELVLTNANTYQTAIGQPQTFIDAGWITIENDQALGIPQVLNNVWNVIFDPTEATGGTFTLSFDGATTDGVGADPAPLLFTAAPADVQTALEDLPTIGMGNVTVTGATGAYVVTFTENFLNELGSSTQISLTGTNSLLPTPVRLTVRQASSGEDDTIRQGAVVAAGAALVLKQTPQGTDLTVPYPLTLSGTGLSGTEFSTLEPWLNQKGALENLGGLNQVIGMITLAGNAGIGAELDGSLSPSPVSQLTIVAAMGESPTQIGSLTKLGSQRVILQGNGTYDGGVVVQQGVLRIENNTALGSVDELAASPTPTPFKTVVDSGAALELMPPPAVDNGGVVSGLEIFDNQLTLNGNGDPAFGDTPLISLAGDEMWRGGISLDTSTTFDVLPNTRLILFGTIDDVNNLTTGGSDLTKIGTGELLLEGANTYRGNTFVEQGILTIGNSASLGLTASSTSVANGAELQLDGSITVTGKPLILQGTGTTSEPAVQSITVAGATAGTFTVTFNNQTTIPLAVDSTAAQVQSALDNLSSIGGVGGEVSVYQTDPTTYTVVFVGSLGGLVQPLMTGSGTGGTTAIIDLISNGNTSASPPLGWFNLGPTPETAGSNDNDGNAPDSNITGRITDIVTDPTNSNVIYISTAGGGAWKTIDGGQIWQPLFDGISAVQTADVSGTGTKSTFTLTFKGQTTIPLAFNASVDTVQAALNNLSSIGGAGGSVTVTDVPTAPGLTPAGIIYSITFSGGTLAEVNVPSLLATPTGGAVVTMATVTEGTGPTTAMFSGAIAIAQTDPRIIYLATGEVGDSGDSYYGTGVYKSINSGQTWTLLIDNTNPVANPIFGQAISSMVLDPINPNIVFVATSDLSVNTPLFTAAAPGVWRWVDNGQGSTTWFDLTGSASAIRDTKLGDPGAVLPIPTKFPPPGTPGPDDDYRIAFPQTSETWSSLSLVYVNTRLYPNAGGGPGLTSVFPATTTGFIPEETEPVLYAALGTANGDDNNAVYWTADPEPPAPPTLTPTPTPAPNEKTFGPETSSPANPPDWFIGNPFDTKDPQADSVQTILVTGATLGTYTLSFTNPITGITSLIGPIQFDADNATFAALASTIAAFGGTANFSTSGGVGDIVITFGGALGNQPIAPITLSNSSLQGTNALVTITQTTFGRTANALTPDIQSSGEFLTEITNGVKAITNGNIKISIVVSTQTGTTPTTFSNIIIYAAVTYPQIVTSPPLNLSVEGTFDAIYTSTNGGLSWTPSTTPVPTSPGTPAYMGAPSEGQGNYDSAILAVSSSTVYVGGHEFGATGLQIVYETINGGTTWTDISADANGNGPQSDVQTFALDSQGRVLAGTSGGIWRWDPTTSTWTDLNGDLSDLLLFSAATSPTDPSVVIAAGQNSGTAVFSGEGAWVQTLGTTGHDVAFDQQNSQIVYAIGTVGIGGELEVSMDGGQTWTPLIPTFTPYVPLVVDTVNPSQLLLGPGTNGGSIFESEDGGQTFVNLQAPIVATIIGEATYQGTFVADARFPDVTDQGSNADDPNTIYISDGIDVDVTKNNGTSWQEIDGFGGTSNLPTSLTDISQITVDPRNRDDVYLVDASPVNNGAGRVFYSTNAGQSWKSLGGRTNDGLGLPDLPAWSLVVDPRTGNVYVGDDNGVWILQNGATVWQRFGANMPNVQVFGLQLNQSLNILTAATYGRGAYQFFLDDNPQANVVQTVSISGATGGTFTLSFNNAPTAALPFNASVTLIQGALAALPTVGNGNVLVTGSVGNYTIAFQNKLANISEPSLVVTNSLAGITAPSITVNAPRAGALRAGSGSPVWLGPVELASSTIVSASGTQALQNNGLSAAQLTIGGSISEFTSLTQSVTVTGATGGTFTLAFQGVTTAPIVYNAGVGLVQSALSALSSLGATNDQWTLDFSGTPAGTFALTFNGQTTGQITYSSTLATLQTNILTALDALSSVTTVGGFATITANVAVTGTALAPIITFQNALGGSLQTLSVDGTGLTTGAVSAVHSTSGAPSFSSVLVTSNPNVVGGYLVSLENQLSLATQPKLVAVGSLFGKSPTVTVAALANFNLSKIGQGDVILSGANTYGGTTEVEQGMLVADNPQALGLTTGITVVDNGAALELLTSINGEPINLNGNGIPFDDHYTGALRNLSNNNTYSGTITLLTNVTIGVDSGSTLTIAPQGATTAQIVGSFSLTKELAGTLILDCANTYTGGTSVIQGAIDIENPTALGASGTTTTVYDGAQLQLQGGITVANEILSITGTGIGGSGALVNNSGNNTWQGPVSLGDQPGFGPATPLNGVVSIDVPNAADTLTIAGAIGESLTSGVSKIGLGNLVWTQADSYTGTTYISSGVLTIQNPNALGAANTNEIQRLTVFGGVAASSYTLTFNGAITASLPLSASASAIAAALDGLTSIKNAGGSVTVSELVINVSPSVGAIYQVNVYTITFGGTMAGVDESLISAAPTIGLSTLVSVVADGGIGTSVSPGASLDLDLDPTKKGATTTVLGETLSLNGAGSSTGVTAGVNAVQTITFGGKPTGGTFTLTFNGQTTSAITYTSVAALLQANIAAALAGLWTIDPGNVSVSSSATLPTITFVGALGQAPIPLIGAISSLTGGSSSTITVSMTTAGVAPGVASGALRNVSGTNIWAGAVTLPTASTIDVDTGTQLTITGTVQDPTLVPIPAATLTKAGAGSLLFPNTNTYSGSTFINGGVLNIASATSLGTPISEVQTITVTSVGGTFTLTFNGRTTAALAYNATAAQVQAALDALATIGGVGGSVTVTLAARIYTITFGGTLGSGDLSQLIPTLSNGAKVTVTTLTDGSAGTAVASGASLQLQGAISVSTEDLVLNGPGFNGAGALENTSGNNLWGKPITLGSNASIGADGTSLLVVNLPITDNGLGFGLAKDGTGTVQFTGTASNLYTGTTTVIAGLLQLDMLNGAIAIAGNLVVGAGTLGTPGNAIAQLLAANQIAPTMMISVNSDGLFDLNGNTQTIAALNMTGGTVALTGAKSVLTLTGNVTATSDSAGVTATIGGAGTLSLGGTTRTFNIAGPGTPAPNLVVSALIVGTASEGLTKTGPGTLQVTDNEAYTGLTTVTAGLLLADGPNPSKTLGAVSLNGGGIGGSGTVGTVTSAAPGGIVAPGDSPTSTAVLTSGTETWNPLTTFQVTLNSIIDGLSDELVVNGNINLAGASLTGTVDPNILLGDSFVIIQTVGGTVSGTLATSGGPSTVYVGGQKFTVSYENPTEVVLTRAKNDAAISVIASVNPSIYGQDVTYTATVMPQGGAGAIPATDTVTFTMDGVITTTVVLNSMDQATFDPQTFASQLLTVGTHTLVVTFNGDSSFNASSNGLSPLVQTVNIASTTIALSSNPAAPDAGQTVDVTATVAPVAPGGGVPNGNIIFTVDGVQQTASPAVLVSGQATLVLSNLGIGVHTFQASYTGSANYKPIATIQAFQVNVQKAPTTINVSVPVGGTVYGQPATLSVTVASKAAGSSLTPGGTVTFLDGAASGGIILGTQTLNAAGTASIQTSALGTGAHTITVLYNGDANDVAGVGTAPFSVLPVGTTATITSSANPVAPGQVVTLTATVVAQTPSTATPVGSVVFVIDGVKQTPSPLTTAGQATITISTLSFGPHTIGANFTGSTNFATSSASNFTESVTNGSQIVVTTSPGNPTLGQQVTLTAVVTGLPAGSGTPSGLVTFVLDGVAQTQQVSLDNTGKASLVVTPAHAGQHTAAASYLGSATFAASNTASVAGFTVSQGATSIVVSSNSPTVFGLAATFTATVTPTAPATSTPTGNVIFVIDGVSQKPVALSSGVATLSLTTLSVGSHTFTASYQGSTDFTASGPSAGGTLVITQASSSTTLVTSSVANPVFGQPVTFTVSVTAGTSSTANANSGSIILAVDGTTATTIVLSTTNPSPATYTTSSLSAGTHTITATYSGSPNLPASNNLPGLTQVVANANTTTTLVSSLSPLSSLGQAVTFTATVSTAKPSAIVPTTGSVNFVIDGVSAGSVALSTAAPGKATLTISSLTAGIHSIVANYSAPANLTGSSSAALSQTVLLPSTITLNSLPAGLVYGQPATLSAVVASGKSGSGTPTGTVTFVIDGVSRAPVAINSSGLATFSVSGLAAGSHTIAANYSGSSTFVPASGTPATLVIAKASTTTTLTSSANPSVVGQAVTFTAQVTPKAPGSGTPTGSVIFTIGGVTQGQVTLSSSGVATLTISTLTAGSHAVTVLYSGDSNFAGSSPAAAINQVVAVPPAGLSATATAGGKVGVLSPFTITVTALNSNGTTDTSYNGPASLTIVSTPAGGTLTGNVSVAFVNGVATFSGLEITKPGTYVFRITSGSLTTTITITSTGRQT